MRPAITFMLRAGAAFALATTFAPLVSGQRSGSAAEARTRVMREARERELRDNEMRERAFDLRMVEEEARRHPAVPRREPRLDIAQIREDFVRLQVVNNDLARAVSGGGELDFKLVARSASEIKKRAERLKENLALPEAPEGEKLPPSLPPSDPGQLRAALSRLDGIVLRFTNALHAKGVRRFDAQSSTRLRLDLEAIIGLSGRVKKGSEKLGEAAR